MIMAYHYNHKDPVQLCSAVANITFLSRLVNQLVISRKQTLPQKQLPTNYIGLTASNPIKMDGKYLDMTPDMDATR